MLLCRRAALAGRWESESASGALLAAAVAINGVNNARKMVAKNGCSLAPTPFSLVVDCFCSGPFVVVVVAVAVLI